MLFRYNKLAPKKILALVIVLAVIGISIMLVIDVNAAENDEEITASSSDSITAFYEVEKAKLSGSLKGGCSSYIDASAEVVISMVESEEAASAQEAAQALAIAEAAAEEKAAAQAEAEAIEALRQEVVDYALQFVGLRYVSGGTSLTYGVDCSGFTMAVYEHFGYTLPRSSYAQASAGTSVSYSEALPGDILVFSGHVGIYIGNGQMVHASLSTRQIYVDEVYTTPIDVRRIIG